MPPHPPELPPELQSSRIVVISDFNCPYCFTLNEWLNQLGVAERVYWVGVEHKSHLPFDFSATNQLDDYTTLLKEVADVQRRAPEVEVQLPPVWVNSHHALLLQAAVEADEPSLAAPLRTAIFRSFWRDQCNIANAHPVDLLLGEVLALLGQAMIAALSVLGVIAIADYGWQYFERMSRLKMTREEMKEEHRQSEGDPIVKQRLRQIRSERSRKRMMSAVPKAAVIITNPTHYAVALAYESGKMGAPVCVAKGVDHVALKIREIGKENNVPIVENPPLARALYASVDVDETIKPEHYKAVAQVIGFVMRLKGKVSSARTAAARTERRQ